MRGVNPELLEAAARLEAGARTGRRAFDLDAVLFGPQLAFVRDRAPFKTACTSRRAGKSVGAAGALLDSAITRPGSVNPYITLSRVNAKRIIWRTLKKLNAEWELRGEPNESDLSLTFPNESVIYLAGAKDKSEIEKFRGLGMGRAVLDEAQALPAYIEELIDDVIEPGLMDFDGDLILIGTPAPVPVGYFYNCTQRAEWSHHAWTVFENPHIEAKSKKSPQAHLERALARRGVSINDPSIQREWFGRWVYDPNALVFRWSPANGYATPPSGTWETVIGVDLGFDDADAIAVLAFAEGRPEAHLREEHVLPKQTVSELAERLGALVSKHEPLAIVMDTGGLGKKIAEEIRKRYALPIKAAEKQRKFEYIELLNDALRSRRFFAPANGRFAQDCMLVEWDRDRSKGDRPVVSDRFHSDICDAVLYAYRESLHWLHEPAAAAPLEGTASWEDAEEIALAERLRAEHESEVSDREWDP
jgi:hypothetical protein